MQSPTWNAAVKGGDFWGTLAISSTLAVVTDKSTVMSLSMVASFMWWMEEAACTAGMPQVMVYFLAYLLHYIIH
jgi:NADH:ubiquinone oxidoreductase subunit 6 (subunit J)